METENSDGLKAPSILVADDNPGHLRLMCDILMEQYWMVRPVQKGADLLQEVISAPPDLIAMDVTMPGINGFDVCSALKRNPATRHIPVIIVTALDDLESRLKGLHAGADDYISKPFNHSAIQERVRNLLQAKKRWDLQQNKYRNLECQLLERTEMLRSAKHNLNEAHAKLLQQEKMASLGLLMAGIAHEINNPAAFISSNLESLGKYNERLTEFIALQDQVITTSGVSNAVSEQLAAQRKSLKIDRLLSDSPQLIRESVEGAEKIRMIARDVQSFSRNDDTKMSASDMNECLRSALRIAMNEIKYKGTVEVELGEIPRIECFPQQMSQVFLNLLVNAAHVIGIQGVISVRSWFAEGCLKVAVSDNGCGIPADNIQRIFEPLFTTKEKGKGTGLGLSISAEIVRRHGGEITVSSRPGEGATFTVSLPVR